MKLPATIESLKRVTIFTVYQSPVNGEEIPVWSITGNLGDVSLSNRKVSSKSRKTNLIFSENLSGSNGLKEEATLHTYQSFRGISPPAESSENNEPVIRFGKSSSLSPGHGVIPEFILYEKILNEGEINKVESYLALKYGITLQKNYITSSGAIAWNYKVDKAYSNNIAGIGRDDEATLYQRQATSSNMPGQLVIGTNTIAASNQDNTAKINNRDLLVWGDNGQGFIFNNDENGAGDIIFTGKKWLMKLSGNSASQLPTELRVDIKELLPRDVPKESFCLVIDRSGSGNFPPPDCEYLVPDSISGRGIASFSNIHWDKDLSGKDGFTFGFKPAVAAGITSKGVLPSTYNGIRSIRFFPNPVLDGHYKIAVNLDKISNAQVRIYDLHQHLLETRYVKGQSSYFIDGYINVAHGPYIVRLTTPEADIYRVIIFL
jgi:hypothetical protein